MKVTSVTATLEPYNPQISNGGIPAEQVNFTVSAASGSFVSGSFSCTIEVLRSGRQVGATTVGFGPPGSSSSSLQESVPVEGIKGDNFAGKPSDAHVVCHVP